METAKVVAVERSSRVEPWTVVVRWVDRYDAIQNVPVQGIETETLVDHDRLNAAVLDALSLFLDPVLQGKWLGLDLPLLVERMHVENNPRFRAFSNAGGGVVPVEEIGLDVEEITPDPEPLPWWVRAWARITLHRG